MFGNNEIRRIFSNEANARQIIKNVSIQNCQIEHLPAILGILEKSNLVDSERDNIEFLTKKLTYSPDSIFIALDSESKIIGTVFTVSDGWAAFIFRLAVDPEYRGKVDRSTGKTVGVLLLESAEAKLRSEGANDVGITVDYKHSSLKSWYKQQGYVATGLYRFMWKTLSNN